MVLIGLLLVALVCLALGLVLASAAWLVGSLAATAAAAYTMWTRRNEIAAPPARKAVEPAAGADSADSADGADSAVSAASADAPGTAESAQLDTEYLQRREAWFQEGTADGDVWVVDGRPNYHASGCRLLVGEKAEPIPYSQATEDGFTACEVCAPVVVTVPAQARSEPDAAENSEPPAGLAAASVPPASSMPVASGAPTMLTAPAAAADLDVWVVDGRPNYHQQDCAQLAGADAEPIPFGQATEDGFAPCVQCHPPGSEDATVVLPAVAAADQGHHGDVWVVDGRPRYHRSDCMIIKDQDAEPIPFEQANEDGFMPCSLCEPNALSR